MTQRLQLALNVTDLASATEFYTKLFGTSPHKQRPGYANFEVAEPPLKLVLFENPNAPQQLNHLGVEVSDSGELDGVATRIEANGLASRSTDDELCCHATQDKLYVDAPDVPLGYWEIYQVTDDAPAEAQQTAQTCCAPSVGS